MLRDPKRMGRWIVIAVAIGLFCFSQALAKKPGGGGGGSDPPPTGTIYYETFLLWSMNADGSQKTELPLGVYGEPSHALHGGHRWFLRSADTGLQNPDGSRPNQLVAVRDDGNGGAFEVPLTDDPTLYVEMQVHAAFRWVDAGAAGADWQVAFVAERRDAGEIVSSGVYVAPVAFDQDGTPVLAGMPTLIIEDVINYHFSPDGTLMAYEQMGTLFILDLLSGNTSMLTVGGLEPSTPQFSPNGLQLSYQSRDRDAGVDGIHVADLGVEPDTGDFFIVRESRVASERHRKRGFGGNYITSGPYWSPTGNYLAYGVETWAGYNRFWTVMCIAADGSNPTNLVPDDGGVPLLIARAWCQ